MRAAGTKTALAALVLAVAVAGRVAAGELAPRWEAIGRMQLEMGGTVTELVVAHDREKNRSKAEQKLLMGSYLTVNVVGQTVNDAGKPASPMVQVTVQQRNGTFELVSVELFDEQGFDAPMVIGPDGGQGDLTAIAYRADRIEATIAGSFQRLTGYSKGTPAPAEGTAPVPVAIQLDVSLPPLK